MGDLRKRLGPHIFPHHGTYRDPDARPAEENMFSDSKRMFPRYRSLRWQKALCQMTLVQPYSVISWLPICLSRLVCRRHGICQSHHINSIPKGLVWIHTMLYFHYGPHLIIKSYMKAIDGFLHSCCYLVFPNFFPGWHIPERPRNLGKGTWLYKKRGVHTRSLRQGVLQGPSLLS